MPELPEVEHARRLLERLTLGRRIDHVQAHEDPIVFDGVAAARVEDALRGATVCAASRWGKVLWLTLDRTPHVVLRLGMTGTVRTPDDEPLVLDSSPAEVDRAWPPRFVKLELGIQGGARLAFTNARRFGRVLLRDDPRAEPPLVDLGFDPLLAMPDREHFDALLSSRGRAVIKGLLLDQSFAAGVGNWIADEVLFQAGIDPRRRVGSLAPDERAALHRALAHVVKTAVAVDARKTGFPKTWLFHHRWRKRAGACTSRGEPIEHLTVAGRTTAWVPTRQR